MLRRRALPRRDSPGDLAQALACSSPGWRGSSGEDGRDMDTPLARAALRASSGPGRVPPGTSALGTDGAATCVALSGQHSPAGNKARSSVRHRNEIIDPH